jgi:hypothetical protein
MTAPTKTGAPSSSGGATKAPAPVMAPWPFPTGVLDTQNLSDYDEKRTQTTGTVKFPDVRVEPDGWTRGIWFDFNMVTSGNSATVAFVENAPFSVIDTVLFRDTGGEQVFGPFDGYDWSNINKFGGYWAVGDPRADVTFSATTGSGGTGWRSVRPTRWAPWKTAARTACTGSS